MRKYYHLLSLITILNLSSFSQSTQKEKIDSLRKQILVLRGEEKSDCLNLLARTISTADNINRKQRPDSVSYFASEAFKEAKNTGYKKGMASALTNQALAELLKGNILRANKQDDTETLQKMENYLSKAIPLAEEIKDNNILGYAFEHWSDMENLKNKSTDPEIQAKYLKKAIAYFQKAGNDHKEGENSLFQAERYMARGYYEDAIDYLLRAVTINKKALPKAETKEEKEYHNYLYQQSLADLADLHKTAGDYKTAMSYVNQAAQYAFVNNTGWNMDTEKAELHRLLGQPDSSFYYLEKIKSKDQKNNWAILGIGTTLLQTNQYDSALSLFHQVLPQFRKVSVNGRALIPALLNMASAYVGKKEYKTALPHVREGMGYALILGARPDVMTAYELLSKIYYNLGNSDSAYQYLIKYNALKDSIQNRQFILRLYSYKKTAEEELKTSQINLLKKDNQLKEQKLKQESTVKKSLIAGLILLILFGFYVFRTFNQKRKNELQKQKLENEKKQTELEMQALRAQMNPHFIFNCLSSNNRFILKNETKVASNYLTRFSRLMRMVLNNSQKTLISLDDELEMLEIYLEMERLRFKNSFDYAITFLNTVDSDNVFIPPLLLQPFCENAIWHGLMNKEEQGRLDIELSMSPKTPLEENNILNCVITDNGVGREKAEEMKSKTAENEKSMGLKITTERLALLNREKGLNTFYEIEDLKDENGFAIGTKVNLKISFKDNVEELV